MSLNYTGCKESKDDYEISVSAVPLEGGIISVPDQVVSKMERIEIRATPNEGYIFQEWLGDISGQENPVIIEVIEDLNIIGIFQKREYPLVINIDGEGIVDEVILQEKVTEYEHGTAVQLTAIPSENWAFDGWTGDIIGNQNPIRIDVTSAKEVTASFKEIPVQVSGKVVDIFLGDTLGVMPSKYTIDFKIDGKTISLSDEGAFEVALFPGEYEFNIESENHYSLDTLIVVDRRTNEVLLPLNPIMLDYFPSQVGNKWVYAGSSGSTSLSTGTRTSTQSEIVWEFIRDSISTITNDSIYVFSSTYESTTINSRIFGNQIVPIDTTQSNKSSFFEMSFPDDFIQISTGNPYIGDIYEIVWGEYGYEFYLNTNNNPQREDLILISQEQYYGVPRYFPISRTKGEDVSINPRSTSQTGGLLLSKGIGFTRISSGHCCSNNNSGYTYELESFEKGN